MPVGGITSYFHATQLSGAVNQAIPTISYAFATNNYNSFGIDATYTGYGSEAFEVTPTLQFPQSGSSITCYPFTANAPSQTLRCNYFDRSLQQGQYTLQFNACPQTPGTACALTILPGYATFSVVPPPITTVTPIESVTVTLTSGATDTTATTSTVPSSAVTVTSYRTTVISVQTSTTTLTGVRPVTVTGACSTIKAAACNHDNCLRAYLAKTSSASAFCASYTGSAPFRGTTPSVFATSCMASPSRLSSACSCLATSALNPRKFIRGMAGAYEEVEPMVEERTTVEEAEEFVEERGFAPLYEPPDYTFAPGQYSGETVFAATATATVTGATVLSTTTTDLGAIASSGTSTSTEVDSSTVTVTVVTSTVDSRSRSTVTVQPTTYAGVTSVA